MRRRSPPRFQRVKETIHGSSVWKPAAAADATAQRATRSSRAPSDVLDDFAELRKDVSKLAEAAKQGGARRSEARRQAPGTARPRHARARQRRRGLRQRASARRIPARRLAFRSARACCIGMLLTRAAKSAAAWRRHAHPQHERPLGVAPNRGAELTRERIDQARAWPGCAGARPSTSASMAKRISPSASCCRQRCSSAGLDPPARRAPARSPRRSGTPAARRDRRRRAPARARARGSRPSPRRRATARSWRAISAARSSRRSSRTSPEA